MDRHAGGRTLCRSHCKHIGQTAAHLQIVVGTVCGVRPITISFKRELAVSAKHIGLSNKGIQALGVVDDQSTRGTYSCIGLINRHDRWA